MNDYDENKETSYIQYCDVNNLYGWTILEQFLVNNAEWIKDTSQVNEDFIKNYNDESDEEYFLKLIFNILNNYMNVIMIDHFHLKE